MGSDAAPQVGRIVVLGEAVRVDGYALAGATVVHAENPDDARRAFRTMPGDVVLVVLTPAAARALRVERDAPAVLTAVMPS